MNLLLVERVYNDKHMVHNKNKNFKFNNWIFRQKKEKKVQNRTHHISRHSIILSNRMIDRTRLHTYINQSKNIDKRSKHLKCKYNFKQKTGVQRRDWDSFDVWLDCTHDLLHTTTTTTTTLINNNNTKYIIIYLWLETLYPMNIIVA